MTTIHTEVTASHEAASIANEEDCCTTIFLRPGETTKHILLGPLLATLRELNEQLLDHSCDNVARGDSVNTDIIGSPFGGEVASELENSGLASIVCGANKTLQGC